MLSGLKKLIGVSAFVAGLFGANPAYAYDWATTVNVTVIEASYVPTSVDFQVNAAVGTCASGAWLNWTVRGSDEATQIANVQAIYALLLTAKASGKQVFIAGTNSGCTVQFMYLLN